MRTPERTITRIGLVMALGISACSNHLDLGHDLQDRVLSPRRPNTPSTPDMPSVADPPDASPDVPDASGVQTPPPVIPTAPDVPTASTCVGIPCFAGPALVLASSMGSAKGLVVDADNIFWAATASQAMMMTPKNGTATTAIATPSAGPYRVAADDTNVYFTSAVGGYLAWMPKSARPRIGPRTPPPITMILQDEPGPQSLVVATEGIYVADSGGGTIKRVTVDRSAPPETLVTGLYDGAELAIDDTSVYYVDSSLGEIHALDRVSNANTLLASGLEHPVAPVLRDDNLYFLELGTEKAGYDDGRLLRMLRAGGTVDVLLDHLEAPTGLTADTAAIYLCTRGTERTKYLGRIIRIADNGQISTLAVHQAEPFGIAVDGSGVYWTADSDSGLHSIAR